jgi:hypothetical protein
MIVRGLDTGDRSTNQDLEKIQREITGREVPRLVNLVHLRSPEIFEPNPPGQ